jgi:hypothetical protein
MTAQSAIGCSSADDDDLLNHAATRCEVCRHGTSDGGAAVCGRVERCRADRGGERYQFALPEAMTLFSTTASAAA